MHPPKCNYSNAGPGTSPCSGRLRGGQPVCSPQLKCFRFKSDQPSSVVPDKCAPLRTPIRDLSPSIEWERPRIGKCRAVRGNKWPGFSLQSQAERHERAAVLRLGSAAQLRLCRYDLFAGNIFFEANGRLFTRSFRAPIDTAFGALFSITTEIERTVARSRRGSL